MRIIDTLLAVVRYSFLFSLIMFIYLIYKMMLRDLSFLRENDKEVNPGKLKYYLYVIDPGDGGNMSVDTALPLKETSTVGRDLDNDIVINDPHVSAKHCRLEVKGEDLYLIDLGSTNGTYLNGRRIKGKEKVSVGDEIIIGDVSFEVVGWENESSSSDRNWTGS